MIMIMIITIYNLNLNRQTDFKIIFKKLSKMKSIKDTVKVKVKASMSR